MYVCMFKICSFFRSLLDVEEEAEEFFDWITSLIISRSQPVENWFLTEEEVVRCDWRRLLVRKMPRLVDAARTGETEKVKKFVQAGDDINGKDDHLVCK